MEAIKKNRINIIIELMKSGKYELKDSHALREGNKRSLAGFMWEAYILLGGDGFWENEKILNAGVNGRWTYDIHVGICSYFGLSAFGIDNKVAELGQTIRELNDKPIAQIIEILEKLCAG